MENTGRGTLRKLGKARKHPPEPPEGTLACCHLDFQPKKTLLDADLLTARWALCVALGHWLCGPLLEQGREATSLVLTDAAAPPETHHPPLTSGSLTLPVTPPSTHRGSGDTDRAIAARQRALFIASDTWEPDSKPRRVWDEHGVGGCLTGAPHHLSRPLACGPLGSLGVRHSGGSHWLEKQIASKRQLSVCL